MTVGIEPASGNFATASTLDDRYVRPYRLVGEITAAQYDRAMEIVGSFLDGVASLVAKEIPDGQWKLLEHARWVLDRIDSGMLRVAEEADPDVVAADDVR